MKIPYPKLYVLYTRTESAEPQHITHRWSDFDGYTLLEHDEIYTYTLNPTPKKVGKPEKKGGK